MTPTIFLVHPNGTNPVGGIQTDSLKAAQDKASVMVKNTGKTYSISSITLVGSVGPKL